MHAKVALHVKSAVSSDEKYVILAIDSDDLFIWSEQFQSFEFVRIVPLFLVESLQ